MTERCKDATRSADDAGARTLPGTSSADLWMAARVLECPAVSRVTSTDVARRAGVSQSTVSLVFSGKAAGRISAATVAAVERAAADLGYRPNVAARTLRTGRTGAVGLIVPDVTNP